MSRHLVSRGSLPVELRPHSWTRRTAVIGAGALALMGVGIASAAWMATGTGSGSAAAGASQTLTATALTQGSLYPASPARTVGGTVTITNPNLFQVTVKTLTYAGAVASNKGANCQGSGTGVTFTAKTNESWTVPAGQTVEFPVASLAAMDLTSHNDCQGATFSQSFTVTGESS